MSGSERAIYERGRRKRLAEERKKYRVLFPWLRRAHPEVFGEFNAFFANLNEKNPQSMNLSVTNDFKRFMRLGKGMCLCFFSCCLLLLL